MKISDILKKLEKEKDPIKFLKALLKTIKDKRLIEEIKKLIKELEPKDNLEDIASNAPKITIEPIESAPVVKYSRERVRVLSEDNVERENNKYGGNTVEDYSRQEGIERVREKLETSGLITKTGFHGTAESQNVIDQGLGEYRLGKGNIDKNMDYAVEAHRDNRDKSESEKRRDEYVKNG